MDLSGLSAITTAAEMKAWLSANCLSPISPVMTGTDLGTIIQKVIDVADEVPMVFGRTGNITADADDYAAFYPSLTSSYADPTWITSLAWSKTTGKPTTLSGYGITDAYPLSGNPSGFLTGITSGQVTAALGFTPYNSANPVGYITSAIAANTYVPYTGATGAVNLGNNTLQSGNLGIGVLPASGVGLLIGANTSLAGAQTTGVVNNGASAAYAFYANNVIASGQTGSVFGFRSTMSTQASTNLGNSVGFTVDGSTLGAGAVITNQYGFFVQSSLTTAANNYGFYGNIANGTGRYNLYMNGDAPNYLAGNLGIGTVPLSYTAFYINKTISSSSASAHHMLAAGTYDSNTTNGAAVFYATPSTAAASYNLTSSYGFRFDGTKLGAGSSVTAQYGFFAHATMTQAAQNFGFYGNIPAGATNFNLYMPGTAMNYLAGNLGIGVLPGSNTGIGVAGTMTGSTGAFGVDSRIAISSAMTATVCGFRSAPSTVAASFNMTNMVHYYAVGLSLGAGASVTAQYGYHAEGSLTGATNNYGFYGNIAFGTGRWNLFMAGTADNYMAGKLGIGTTSLGAKLNLGAASALQASLNIATGVLLTTPVSGAIEYDGTHLYYTTNTPKRQTLAVLDSPVFTGTVSMPHFKGNSGTPTINYIGSGAGTSPTITVSGTDAAGIIHVVTGTSPAANSIILEINFAQSYNNAAYVIIAPQEGTQSAGTSGVCAGGGANPGAFMVLSGNTALASGTSYYFAYHVIG